LRTTFKRALWAAALPILAFAPAIRADDGKLYSFPVSSAYWCTKLAGTLSGETCSARYTADSRSCSKFERLQPDDAAMRQTIADIKSTSVCLGDTVEQAKSNTLRLRADLMGYVTAGRDESVNDPVSPNSEGIVERAQNGGAPYWPLVQYYLYQCVVEVCEAK
jgi:hypothetical protein